MPSPDGRLNLPNIIDNSEPSQTAIPPENKLPEQTLPWSLKSAFILCFAYANFCFFSAWQQLESRYFDFFLSPPVRVDVVVRYVLALLADIAILTLVLWGVYVWISRKSIPHASSIVALGFLGLLVIPLNLLRAELKLFSLDNKMALAAVLVLGIAAIIWHKVLIKPVAALLIFSWPLMFVELISSARHVISAAKYVEPAQAQRFSGAPPRRIVWMIFDEFDEGLAFESRPPGMRLPNLDDLKAKSVSGNNAYRSQRATPLAIPSLLLGKIVSRETIAGPVGLNLTFTDGTSQSYPFTDNIFSLVRRRGINAAVGGWYLPYCRLFNDSLTDCVSVAGESQVESISTFLDPPLIESIPKAMVMFPRDVLARLPGVDRLGVTWAPIGFAITKTRAARQVIEFQSIRQAALRFSTDPGLGFVYLHFPIPHTYGIYNSATSQVEPGGNYFDNLQLVDKTLGELRSAMEQAQMWDSATVLVSTDHSLRHDGDSLRHARDPGAVDFVTPEITAEAEGRRVPFFLKLPSQQIGIPYETPFNAVLTRDLLLSILSGDVSTPEQAVQWLDTNRKRAPVISY
jgi:hypothetical protein